MTRSTTLSLRAAIVATALAAFVWASLIFLFDIGHRPYTTFSFLGIPIPPESFFVKIMYGWFLDCIGVFGLTFILFFALTDNVSTEAFFSHVDKHIVKKVLIITAIVGIGISIFSSEIGLPLLIIPIIATTVLTEKSSKKGENTIFEFLSASSIGYYIGIGIMVGFGTGFLLCITTIFLWFMMMLFRVFSSDIMEKIGNRFFDFSDWLRRKRGAFKRWITMQ